MRHVVITGTPPQEWLDEAERLTQLLRAATSKEERGEIIDANQRHWRDDNFRDWLIDQFHRKCWYSEAKESVSSYHVDHFRPKGRIRRLDKTYQQEGYWWLAFQWENYRISGQLLNVKKLDWFPLHSGHRADPFDDDSLALEASVLLDPRIEEDAWLISFQANGEATCAEGIDADDKFRVAKTIEIFGLNRVPRLVRNRMDTWNECLEEILKWKNASGPQCIKMVHRASATKNLKKMAKYESEFSSIALACIRMTAPEPLYKQVMH